MQTTAQRTITTLMPKTADSAEKPSVIRYAPYCRVSSDSSDQEQSFAAQVKYYAEAIGKMENAELADIYADEAVSGRGTNKREDFNRLLDDCRKGKIDWVITKSVSRFARNTVDCLAAVRLLSACGVSILFEKEGIDTADMSSEVLLAMSGTQAQDESISHGNNMRWSYETRMKAGEFLGCSPAYGYTMLNSAEHIINEKEARIVVMIKDLYLSGTGKQKIANRLNSLGISNRGRAWTPFAVSYILNNERYTGDALLQKSMTTAEWPPCKIKNDGSRPQYYVENAIPAIFTKADREAILALQASRQNPNTQSGGHALSKMLICPECGHPYRRVKTKNEFVWCCAYRTSGRTQCANYTLPEADVCKAFLRCINTLYKSRDEILLPLISRIESLQSNRNGTETKIYTIDREIAKLSKQSLVISDLLSQGILDAADFTMQSSELANTISGLRTKQRELLNMNKTDDMLTEMRRLNEQLEDMEAEMTEYDDDIVRSVIDRATVISDTEIKIRLHGGLELTEQLPKYYTARCKRK